MRLLAQRVTEASVTVDGVVVAEIKKGLLVLVGIGRDDTADDVAKLSDKIAALRIFEDDGGKMNLNIKQVGGAILSVPQFTLYADTRKGNRPGFDSSAPPAKADELWKEFNRALIREGVPVEEGVFGTHMEVGLINDGPVTLWLDSGR